MRLSISTTIIQIMARFFFYHNGPKSVDKVKTREKRNAQPSPRARSTPLDREKARSRSFGARERTYYPRRHRQRFQCLPRCNRRFQIIPRNHNMTRRLTPALFHTRWMLGLNRISRHLPFPIIEVKFHPQYLILYCRPAERNELSPKSSQRLFADNGTKPTMDYLSSGQNLIYFLQALEFLFSQVTRKYSNEIERQKAERSPQKFAKLINAEIRQIFKGKKVFEIKLENTDRSRNDELIKRKEEEKREERKAEKERLEIKQQNRKAQKKELLIRKLVEAGRIIRAATVAIKTRSVTELLKIISQILNREKAKEDLETIGKSEAINLIERICSSKPKAALPLLIETAVHLTLDKNSAKEAKEALQIISEIIAKAIKADLETNRNAISARIHRLINELEDAHLKKSASIIPEEPQVRAAVIRGVLEKVPEALPYLLKKYTQHFSWIRSLAARVGIKTRDFAARELKPLILKIAQESKGESVLLKYVSESKATHKSNQAEVPREVAEQVVRNILAKSEEAPSVFTHKNRADEMRETILEIAKENNLMPSKLTAAQAITLLAIAAKIQKLLDLIRNGKYIEAKILHEELDNLNGAREIHSLRLPAAAFDLLATYLNSKTSKNGRLLNAEQQISFRIIEISDRNLFTARKVIDVLKNHVEIWKALSDKNLQEKGQTEKSESGKLRFSYFVKYAYSFLTAKKSDQQIKNDVELLTLIQQDVFKKQLFMMLQYIPPTVREELLNYFKKVFAETGQPRLALEIEILQKLLSIKDSFQHANRREFAARILRALQEYGGGRIWANILEIAQKGSPGEIEGFFKRLIKNLEDRETDLESIKLAIKSMAPEAAALAA